MEKDFLYRTEEEPIIENSSIEIEKNFKKMEKNDNGSISILVYEDEEGQKYMDIRTLTYMTGSQAMHTFRDENGVEIGIPEGSLTQIPAEDLPAHHTPIKTVYPDFSDRFTYNEQLGLYEVTEEDIATIIGEYKALHTGTDVFVAIKKITSKKENSLKEDILDFKQSEEKNKKTNNEEKATNNIGEELQDMLKDNKKNNLEEEKGNTL